MALTASVLDDERARYAEAGMEACLAEPVDVAKLNAVLGRVPASARWGCRSRP